MPLPEGGRPEHEAYEEPPLTTFLREQGFDIDGVIQLLAVRARRVYGFFKNPGSASRATFLFDTCLPASFLLDTEQFKGLVSLRVSLPTRLTERLLSVAPQNPRPVQGHHLRDNARGRGRH